MQAGRRVPGGALDLSIDELRAVARYAAESAEEVLHHFEQRQPGDRRPRTAIEAAWAFVRGADPAGWQRPTVHEAHRAALEAADEAARYAALAAGDAAVAAYLHPLVVPTQVGHILSAAAHAARACELAADDVPGEGDRSIERARRRADPLLVDVLRRYPRPFTTRGRVAQLIQNLDTALRSDLGS